MLLAIIASRPSTLRYCKQHRNDNNVLQRKHHNRTLLPIERGAYRLPVDYHHRGTVMCKAFSCHDVIMFTVMVAAFDPVKGLSRTVCFLGRGDTFGELAIINKTLREITVISKSRLELLCLQSEVGWQILIRLKYIVFCQHWNGAGIWNPCSWKTRMRGSHIANFMFADVLQLGTVLLRSVHVKIRVS